MERVWVEPKIDEAKEKRLGSVGPWHLGYIVFERRKQSRKLALRSWSLDPA